MLSGWPITGGESVSIFLPQYIFFFERARTFDPLRFSALFPENLFPGHVGRTNALDTATAAVLRTVRPLELFVPFDFDPPAPVSLYSSALGLTLEGADHLTHTFPKSVRIRFVNNCDFGTVKCGGQNRSN